MKHCWQISNGVAGLENAVEAFIKLTKNNPNEIEQEDNKVVSEIARPFQSIVFDQMKPLTIHEVLAYFDQEDKAITQMPF